MTRQDAVGPGELPEYFAFNTGPVKRIRIQAGDPELVVREVEPHVDAECARRLFNRLRDGIDVDEGLIETQRAFDDHMDDGAVIFTVSFERTTNSV